MEYTRQKLRGARLFRRGQDVGRRALFGNHPLVDKRHAVGDFAFSFSAMPTGPRETVVTSKWLVHADAVEGVDYDLGTLTALWTATNLQDRDLVENNQRGVDGAGYRLRVGGMVAVVVGLDGTLVGQVAPPCAELQVTVVQFNPTTPGSRKTAPAALAGPALLTVIT